MRSIWKHELAVGNEPLGYEIPGYGGVAHVTRAGPGLIEFWSHVDTGEPERVVWFRVYGTGHAIPADAKHVGTVLDGPFVWHVCEVTS